MDEELFSQKNHEVQILQNQIKTLLQEKEEQQEFLKEAEETQRLQVFFLWYTFICTEASFYHVNALNRCLRIFFTWLPVIIREFLFELEMYHWISWVHLVDASQ